MTPLSTFKRIRHQFHLTHALHDRGNYSPKSSTHLRGMVYGMVFSPSPPSASLFLP
jgi:hypothetical protein